MGARFQSPIRARLLGSLSQSDEREVTFLRVLPASASQGVVVMSDDVVAEVVDRAAGSDLVILGLKRIDRRRKVFGEKMLEIAQAIGCPVLMISQRS